MPGLGHWYVEIEKQAFWRGNPHTWVNRYVLSGPTPSETVAQDVINQLKLIEGQLHPQITASNGVGFVIGRAYGATGGPPFATIAYNASAEPSSATGFPGAGWDDTQQGTADTLEVCTLVEVPLQGLSSTGKPVTLRKYFRMTTYGSIEDTSGASIGTIDRAGIAAVCLPWTTGLGSGGATVIGTSGRAPSDVPTAHPYIVNHQVPRGRKRKSASSLVGVYGSVNAGVVTMTLPNPHDVVRLKRWQLDNDPEARGVEPPEPLPFDLFP